MPCQKIPVVSLYHKPTGRRNLGHPRKRGVPEQVQVTPALEKKKIREFFSPNRRENLVPSPVPFRETILKALYSFLTWQLKTQL